MANKFQRQRVKEKNLLLHDMWQMTKHHYNICVFEMKCCVAWQTVTAA